jgi:hypothetical protein
MITVMNSENLCKLFKVEYISFTGISVLDQVTMREMFSEYKYSVLPFLFLFLFLFFVVAKLKYCYIMILIKS